MRILFVMRHGGYVRNFEWVLRLLAERSHQVELGFERGRAEGMAGRIKRGRADFPLPERLRLETSDAVTLRDRPHPRRRLAASRLRPPSIGQLSALPVPGVRPRGEAAAAVGARYAPVGSCDGSPPGLRSRAGLAALERLLRIVERLVPRSREIAEHLRSGAYDLVVITPLVDGPSQHDWLRSARRWASRRRWPWRAGTT